MPDRLTAPYSLSEDEAFAREGWLSSGRMDGSLTQKTKVGST